MNQKEIGRLEEIADELDGLAYEISELTGNDNYVHAYICGYLSSGMAGVMGDGVAETLRSWISDETEGVD